MFQWGIIGSVIIVASIIGGLPWGAVGVAASYSVVFVCVVMPLLLWFVGREGPVRTIDVYQTIAPSLCAALSVLGALALFRWRVEVSRPIYGLAASFGITVAITLLIFALLPRGRKALKDLKHSYFLLMEKPKPVQEQKIDVAV